MLFHHLSYTLGVVMMKVHLEEPLQLMMETNMYQDRFSYHYHLRLSKSQQEIAILLCCLKMAQFMLGELSGYVLT